jgi:hypothetical protein
VVCFYSLASIGDFVRVFWHICNDINIDISSIKQRSKLLASDFSGAFLLFMVAKGPI